MDIFDVRVRFPLAILLGTVWALLTIAPLMAAGVVPAPPLSFWIIFGGLFFYFIYTGMRAQRSGWTSRFVLRVLVPVALLAISSAITGMWLWFSH